MARGRNPGAGVPPVRHRSELALKSRMAAGRGPVRAQDLLLGDADVLGAGALWTLPALKRHRLAFAKLVEARAGAGGLVKEVLTAVTCRDKAESLVGQPFDRAIHCRHRRLADALSVESWFQLLAG